MTLHAPPASRAAPRSRHHAAHSVPFKGEKLESLAFSSLELGLKELRSDSEDIHRDIIRSQEAGGRQQNLSDRGQTVAPWQNLQEIGIPRLASVSRHASSWQWWG